MWITGGRDAIERRDPDAYFAGIRNLRIDGLVTRRGEFRAKSTRIDLHRLWMHPLQREAASDYESYA